MLYLNAGPVEIAREMKTLCWLALLRSACLPFALAIRPRCSRSTLLHLTRPNPTQLNPDASQRPFTRTLLARNEGSATWRSEAEGDAPGFDLLLLCWRPGAASVIHDHPEAGCWVKVGWSVGWSFLSGGWLVVWLADRLIGRSGGFFSLVVGRFTDWLLACLAV